MAGSIPRFRRYAIILSIMAPIFLAVGILSNQQLDPHRLDFTHFWLAGHMNVESLNVYDSDWVNERLDNGIQWIPENYFLYPLPLSVLLSPLGMLPLNLAYITWVFVSQVCILASILLLMKHFYLHDLPYIEWMTMAGIFLFRPSFIVIVSGQIDPYLLFSMALSAYFFGKRRYLASGVLLSFISLKPSLGIPILVLVGLWFLIKRHWKAIAGMLSGLILLFLIGAVRNPYWLLEYLSVTQQKMTESYTLHSTLWGFSSLMPFDLTGQVAFGLVVALTLVGVDLYLFRKIQFRNDLFPLLAIIIPIGLLVAPYAWVYNQILLAIPIVFILAHLSQPGQWKPPSLFMIELDALAIGLAIVSYELQHDILSFLIPLFIWLVSIYLISRKPHLPSAMEPKPGNLRA